MNKAGCAILIIVLLTALPLMAAEKKLGQGVSLKTATSVKEILANPDKFLGKDVMIDGEMTSVCQMAGCWVMVKDASSEQPIMVKVQDGVIVFPKDGAGKKIVVQGKVEKVSDEAQQEAGSSSPYRIAGTGAVLK